MSVPVKDHLFYVREFLNSPGFESTAVIRAGVDRYGYAFLDITDCAHKVSISLGHYEVPNDLGELENSIAKLKLMEDTIRGLRVAMIKSARKKGYRPAAKEVPDATL
jgi:hypothetical protein